MTSLNYIKQNRLKDTLWKREHPAQMALPPIATSMPPWYYYQRGRFLRRAFSDTCLPLGVVVENVIPIFIGIGTSSIIIKYDVLVMKKFASMLTLK